MHCIHYVIFSNNACFPTHSWTGDLVDLVLYFISNKLYVSYSFHVNLCHVYFVFKVMLSNHGKLNVLTYCMLKQMVNHLMTCLFKICFKLPKLIASFCSHMCLMHYINKKLKNHHLSFWVVVNKHIFSRQNKSIELTMIIDML